MKKNLLLLIWLLISLMSFTLAQDVTTSWENNEVNVNNSETSTETSTDLKTNSSDTWEDLNINDLDLNSLDLNAINDSETKVDNSTVWGFTDQNLIMIKDSSNWVISLEIPVINWPDWNKIQKFKVSYSKTSFVDTTTTSDIKEVKIDLEDVSWSTSILSISWLDLTSKYYFVIEPLTNDEKFWQKSKEIEFTPSEVTMDSGHSAASTWNQLTDFTYTYSWMQINLKWTPVQGPTKAEFYIRTESQQDFTKLWDTKMNDWSFNFSLTKTWDYYVKFIPTDDNWTPIGAEIVKSIKLEEWTTPSITRVPRVWPAENLMIIILSMSTLLYIVYRVRKN